jgi:hypothetical protein
MNQSLTKSDADGGQGPVVTKVRSRNLETKNVSQTLFQLTMTDEERRRYADFALWLNGKLMNASPVLESSPPQPSPNATPTGAAPPAARAPQPAPIEVRDRWAKDRKGNELPFPKDCTAGQGKIWKTEERPTKDKKGTYLKVTWEVIAGAGHVDANCFDKDLRAWVAKVHAEGKPTTLYTVHSGNYVNLVGIRA